MATNSRRPRRPAPERGPSRALWPVVGVLGAILVLLSAIVVGRSLGGSTASAPAAAPAAQSAAVADHGGEKHEPADLAKVEAGQLGQPSLVWFGASW